MTKKHGRSFAGRVALVTGGSRGIGKGIVRRLASDGTAVAFRYSSSEEKAKRLASRNRSCRWQKVLPIKADSASAEDDRERGQYQPSSSRAKKVAVRSAWSGMSYHGNSLLISWMKRPLGPSQQCDRHRGFRSVRHRHRRRVGAKSGLDPTWMYRVHLDVGVLEFCCQMNREHVER